MKMTTNQAVATDSKGEPRKLNPAQLESIRQTGQFQVRGRLGLLLMSLDGLKLYRNEVEAAVNLLIRESFFKFVELIH